MPAAAAVYPWTRQGAERKGGDMRPRSRPTLSRCSPRLMPSVRRRTKSPGRNEENMSMLFSRNEPGARRTILLLPGALLDCVIGSGHDHEVVAARGLLWGGRCRVFLY